MLLAFAFIYHRLNNSTDLKQFRKLVAGIDHTWATFIMSVVSLLMLVNWVLEAAKWKYLAQRLAHMSLWRSIEAVFCGLTWAIFTPNRLGEYAGRVMFLPQRRRIHGVFAMAVGSFGQNVVTNVVGASSIIWVTWHFLHLTLWLYIVLVILLLGLIAVMLLCYFNMSWMVYLLNKIAFLHKYHRFFDIMGRYRLAELLRVMGFCIARFAAFSFQYYLVVHLLIPEIPFYDTFLFIFVVFFIQSALPSLDLLDISVRNITGLALFAYVTDQKIAVMAAITSIWFINLIIPAILGSVFVFKLKFFDNNL